MPLLVIAYFEVMLFATCIIVLNIQRVFRYIDTTDEVLRFHFSKFGVGLEKRECVFTSVPAILNHTS